MLPGGDNGHAVHRKGEEPYIESRRPLATMINGLWKPFWLLIVLLIVAVVTRIVSVAMSASVEAD